MTQNPPDAKERWTTCPRQVEKSLAPLSSIQLLIEMFTHSWMTPLCKEAQTQGRFGWKANPFTRADFDSNLVSMVYIFAILSCQ